MAIAPSGKERRVYRKSVGTTITLGVSHSSPPARHRSRWRRGARSCGAISALSPRFRPADAESHVLKIEKLLSRFNGISGLLLRPKDFSLRKTEIMYSPRRPASARGAYASSRTLRRDAMDAGGIGSTNDVARGRRRRVVLAPLGWCQACEMMILQATVTKRSWTPGRARTTSLTPLRREGRTFRSNLWFTYSCASYTAHEAAGAISIRPSLRPLSYRGSRRCKTRVLSAARMQTLVRSAV
jgi:hypothetical protein